jgi:hypothetical protein
LALIEHHFKVGRATSASISRAPFNVKLPIGRSAGDGSENAASTRESCAVGRYLIGAQVALIRENGHCKTKIRQGTVGTERIGVAKQLQIAIGTDRRTVKELPVNSDREWERNASGTIIAMVAGAGDTRDDGPQASRGNIVIARENCRSRCWRCRCRWSWCWRRCCRWSRRGRWAPWSENEVDLQALGQPARAALILREVRAGIALRAYGSGGTGVTIQVTIDDLEVGRILVQTDLKIEGRWPT